jgi:hypothetical protein
MPSGLICNERWGICVVPTCAGQEDFMPCETVASPDRSYDICSGGTCVSPGCGTASCNAPGPNWRLADTNQRTCYDTSGPLGSCPEGIPPDATCDSTDLCGQDAQYGWDATHPATERFTRTTEAEPVVTDNVTGLMWQGCSRGQTGSSCTGSASSADWNTALSYCDDLSWGGYTDWRLPDEYELLSIVDYGVTSGLLIDRIAFPATPAERFFWSSSSYAGSASNAWLVNFNNGSLGNGGKTNSGYVRCVRAGPSGASTPRFSRTVVAGDPVVADAATGLVWQGCPAGMTGDASSCTGTAITRSWQGALDYCQDSTWGGYTDWYLPNVKELRSIVDNRRTGPAIDTTAFPGTPSSYFWSSSSYAGSASNAWNVYFYNGVLSSSVKTYTFYVRCVRAGP